MGHHRRFSIAFLLVVAGAAAGSAAEPQRVQELGDSIDVRVVNVEAVITDGKGNRVRGLSAADFRLLVDGREVPVEYFTEIEEGKAAVPASATSARSWSSRCSIRSTAARSGARRSMRPALPA